MGIWTRWKKGASQLRNLSIKKWTGWQNSWARLGTTTPWTSEHRRRAVPQGGMPAGMYSRRLSDWARQAPGEAQGKDTHSYRAVGQTWQQPHPAWLWHSACPQNSLSSRINTCPFYASVPSYIRFYLARMPLLPSLPGEFLPTFQAPNKTNKQRTTTTENHLTGGLSQFPPTLFP